MKRFWLSCCQRDLQATKPSHPNLPPRLIATSADALDQLPYHLLHLTLVRSTELSYMKFLLLSVLASTAVNTATCYTTSYIKGFTARPPTFLAAEIRPPSSKAKELRFGWDGTTALGGAEVDSKPARMLDDVKASGETLHPDGGENSNRRLIGVADGVAGEIALRQRTTLTNHINVPRTVELFLQNYEMDPKGFKFEEVRTLKGTYKQTPDRQYFLRNVAAANIVRRF